MQNKVLKKVHKEKALVLLSTLLTILLSSVGGYFLFLTIQEEIIYGLGIGLAIVPLATIIISYGYAPMYIEVSNKSLVVHRGIGKKTFDFAEIKGIHIYTNTGAAVRTCGIGGLFGFTGRYYTRKLGHYFSYVGDYSQTFYIERKDGKKYLLSCEDCESVVSLLKKNISEK